MKPRVKQIPGMENYFATNWGDIISTKVSTRNINGDPMVLKPTVMNSTRIVTPNSTVQSISKLVMLTFKGPKPKGKEIMHINGDPSDNRLSNLKYQTRAQINAHHKPASKVTAQDVKRIRREWKRRPKGFTYRELARNNGISLTAAWNIVNGVTHTDIK